MEILRTVFALCVGFTPIVLFMFLFTWLRRSAKRLEPRERGGSLEFYVSPRMRILLWTVISLLTGFIILVSLVSLSKNGDGWYAIFIPMAVLCAIFAAMPRTVVVDHRGIRQQRWIRQDREISWENVAWMRRGINSGATYVKSANGGRPISFSPLLAGQRRFEREVRTHANKCDALDE